MRQARPLGKPIQTSLYLGLLTLSASALLLEVGLTRIFAITQWYHFAFLVVSMALLGFGAGGSLHSALRKSGRPPGRGLLAGLSALFALTCLAILLVNHFLPLDLYILAWDRRQYLYLVLQCLVLVLPFLIVGLGLSLLLEAYPERPGPLYASNLVGSALGTLLAPPLLGLLGAGRLPLAAGLLAAVAAAIFRTGRRSRGQLRTATTTPRHAPTVLILLLIVLLLYLTLDPPSALALRLDPHKSLVQQLRFPGARLRYSQENAFSRVDVIDGGPYHAFPGLPLIPSGTLPQQMALTLDGDHPSPLTRFDPQIDDPAFLHTMLTALPYRLHPQPHTLLIEPLGGLDLLQALEQGADRVVVLEKNPLIVEVATKEFAAEIGGIFGTDAVQLEQTGARSYLARRGEPFDLIVFSLTGNRAVVTAGAYSLIEENLLTVEAFQDAFNRLAPGGAISVMRWLQDPPSEELRTLATITEAMKEQGIADPERHLIALRGWATLLLLTRQEPFAAVELDTVRAFCQEWRCDLVWLPDIERGEANQYNHILEGPIYHDAFAAFLAAEEPRAFYDNWTADVRPTRDERPFFYHFFRWQQIPRVLEQYGQSVQPFGGAGFVVLPFFLAIALVVSTALILLPLVFARRRSLPEERRASTARPAQGWPEWSPVLLYFSALGLGFMGIEIPLLGRFTLFLDQPLYATAVVLFALLVGSGLGSLLGGNRSRWLRPALAALLGVGVVYALFLPRLLHAALGLRLAWRLLLGVALLLPLGFLMGIPFPAGLRSLGKDQRHLIPWAWAVNGCASVLGAIGAQIAALSWGYGAVLLVGTACYGIGWAVLRWVEKRIGRVSTDGAPVGRD